MHATVIPKSYIRKVYVLLGILWLKISYKNCLKILLYQSGSRRQPIITTIENNE